MVISKMTFLSDPKIWQATYRRARKGAMKDIEKFMELVEPAIKQEARLYTHNSHDFDDFCQHTREYILQILQTKKEVVKKVQNYFIKTIKCEMVQCACNRTKNKSRFINGIQEALIDDKSFENSVKNGMTKYFNEDIAAYCDLKEVLRVIKTLPKKVQQIILAPVSGGAGKSSELSKELNMTAENIDKIRERTRKMLKKIFSDKIPQQPWLKR